MVISGPFTANTRFRFRCDASGNGDRVYFDDIIIDGCLNNNREDQPEEPKDVLDFTTNARQPNADTPELGIRNFQLFPNPTSDQLNYRFDLPQAGAVEVIVTDFTGKVVGRMNLDASSGVQQTVLDAQQLTTGFYFVNLVNNGKITSKKFVVTH